MNKSFNDLLVRLVCPICLSQGSEVALLSNQQSMEMFCPGCEFSIVHGARQIDFLKLDQSIISDPLDRIKHYFKKFETLYKFLIEILSSVSGKGLKRIYKELESVPKKSFIVNIGSGNSKLRGDVFNSDIFPYPNVALVCFADAIPVESNSVDLVISIAMLEHVDNPSGVICEALRILRPGGELIGLIPFMQGVHASPYDFQRYTSEGLKVLFDDFEVIEIRGYGPTSALLWMFQEWVSTALSFGQRRLQILVWLLLQPMTFFIKYLDVFFDRMTTDSSIPSYYFFKVRKPENRTI
jgi:SAM-dependent methyltransferase